MSCPVITCWPAPLTMILGVLEEAAVSVFSIVVMPSGLLIVPAKYKFEWPIFVIVTRVSPVAPRSVV